MVYHNNSNSVPLTFNPVFYRTYSRIKNAKFESFSDVVNRCATQIVASDGAPVGNFGLYIVDDVKPMMDFMKSMIVLPSGRMMWVGGTEFMTRGATNYALYNCVSVNLTNLDMFGLLMNLAMLGCGTGAVLLDEYVSMLPNVLRKISVSFTSNSIGAHYDEQNNKPNTDYDFDDDDTLHMLIGDSRRGWVEAYQALINLVTVDTDPLKVIIDLSHIRPKGTVLKGLGGVANPNRLPLMFSNVAEILNKAYDNGGTITPYIACRLIDEAAAAVVAGNIRRSAGMRQFSKGNKEMQAAKSNLYSVDEFGTWHIDPSRESLRMANHTEVFMEKPTKDEVRESVTRQFYSGEGAIQYAPVAIQRSGKGDGFGLNPCGEIIGSNFVCNLSEVHLNNINPNDFDLQKQAFKVAAKWVLPLLKQYFDSTTLRLSRKLDPIVGVSFTGLFDFFVNAFGVAWLQWMMDGRPSEHEHASYWENREKVYLVTWRMAVKEEVDRYCSVADIKKPNRYTTVQPAGTKSLLTGASPGWNAPKATRYIRRITMARESLVAQACLKFGYPVVPAQGQLDENGFLLKDAQDPHCTEWLIEIPVELPWADKMDALGCDISNLPAISQLELFMQVQKHYTTHNTSSTIELYEHEIPVVADTIYNWIQDDEPYISTALMPKYEGNSNVYPNLPIEPISKDEYKRRVSELGANANHEGTFHQVLNDLLKQNNDKPVDIGEGQVQCESDKCGINDHGL